MKVLKEQVSVKATDVNLATPVTQPCAVLVSQKESITSSKRTPEVYLQAEPKGVNETKHNIKDPFHVISSEF